MQNDLSALPNIGPVIADKLAQTGIDSPAKLREAGAENAFLRLKAVRERSCILSLYALEGAIQGIRWHDLDPARKEELRAFHKMAALSDK